MSNIPHNQFSPAQFPNKQLPAEYQSAAYAKELSFNSKQSSNTDLVIETKEGDTVTLSANSFSEMSAYMYSSKGYAQTEEGTAKFSMNQRQITLSSGRSFSFSVQGDLSEDELEDIEEIVKGLDGVMSEMRDGDMAGAMEKAVTIGSYDSISAYSADLTFERSYEVTAAVAASAQHIAPQEGQPGKPEKPGLQEGRTRIDFESFFDKLIEQLEKQEEKLLKLVQSPLNKLFEHHLEETEEEESGTLHQALKDGLAGINSFLASLGTPEEESVIDEQAEPAISEAQETDTLEAEEGETEG